MQLEVETFPEWRLLTPREQCLKLLEEVAELFAEIERGDMGGAVHEYGDVLQAWANLGEAMGLPHQACYDVSKASNKERGRFDG